MSITVRQATIDDKLEIFSFLDLAYGENARYKYPERWEWQFVHNPFKPLTELPVWIAITEEGKIVGQSCAMYEPIKVEDKTLTIAWALDAIVLPDFRGLNLGFETLRTNCDTNGLWAGLSMAESSRHILTKLGCLPIDRVAVFERRLRVDSESVSHSIGHRLNKNIFGQKLFICLERIKLAKGVAACGNLLIKIRDKFMAKPNDNGIQIIQIDHFENSLDTWWDSIKADYPIIIQRDSKFLNWKFVDQPFMNYQRFLAVKDGQICGYVILRCATPPESNRGIIADILIQRQDKSALESLVAFSVDFFKHKNLDLIEVASTIDEYMNIFKRFGFKKFKEMRPLVQTKVSLPVAEMIFAPDNWFLGRSDHDWDQFPLG